MIYIYKGLLVRKSFVDLSCLVLRYNKVAKFRFVFVQNEQAATELARIAGEFAEEEAAGNTCVSKGDDLLAMMDDL